MHLVYDSKMWVVGGNSFQNDVWSSVDGVMWIEVTSSPQWIGRYGHTSVVFNDNLWVLGAQIVLITMMFGALWYCYPDYFPHKYTNLESLCPFIYPLALGDGTNWTEATYSSQWSSRYDHT